MFESLRRAIDEIFGSVIKPIKEWILRQSWAVRLLCLILIAGGAFAIWKPATVQDYGQQASFYWRAWRAPDNRIPLSANAGRSLALASERLAQSVEADLAADLEQSPFTPWSLSQSTLALSAVDRTGPDADAFVRFVKSKQLSDCFCWTELVDDPRKEVSSFISGWVMSAFADLKVGLAPAELDYVLAKQNSAGWWPMFPESGASRYASTYSTAWLALGLHRQRAEGLIPSEKRQAVDRSLSRAAGWLLRTRHGARWRLHPNGPDPDGSETVSALVIYVLHEVGVKHLQDVDRAWINSLPVDDLAPSSLEKHYIVLPYGNRSVIDHVVQIRLPWILLATAKTYPSGSPAQKARIMNWLERVLLNPDVQTVDTHGVEWVRAEVLVGLGYTGGLVDCDECPAG